MSKEFIEKAYNAESITKATSQEKQLIYLLTSDIQDEKVDVRYLQEWASRNYQTSDYFLNWLKTTLKTDVFLNFFKYMRFPLPSTKIVKNRIEPQLKRVFNAEDSIFTYDVNNVDESDYLKDLDIRKFNKEIFQKILYKHNSLIVSDLDSEVINKPVSYYIDISNVVSILFKGDQIDKIAFTGNMLHEGDYINGIFYIDSENYQFYDKEKELVATESHDLGYTPVHFIASSDFSEDPVIKRSLYSFIREELEDYNFLKILQKFTNLNGSIPVVTKIEEDKDVQGQRGFEGQPDTDTVMGSQQSEVSSENVTIGDGDLQPGRIHEIPVEAVRDIDGKINMDAVRNYLNFHFIPIEVLEFLNERVKEVERSIITTVVGDVLESNESSKNELQNEKSISIIENTLTSLSIELSRIRELRDKDILRLKYGVERVQQVYINYGTDFFLDSQKELLDEIKTAPNTLERKNLIVRLNQNRYKNNPDNSIRVKLLYDLMPYVSDIDFQEAIKIGTATDINKELQTRFSYWISHFEAKYGDIVEFYKSLESDNSSKLIIINNLLTGLVEIPEMKSKPEIN